jgi:hypothetical protein
MTSVLSAQNLVVPGDAGEAVGIAALAAAGLFLQG